MPKKEPPPAPWSVISDAYWSRAGDIPEPWSREAKPVRMAVVVGLFHTQMLRISRGLERQDRRDLNAGIAGT